MKGEMTPREGSSEPPSDKARLKRRQHLRVPVFDYEKAMIEAAAKQAGISMARYLREVGMGYPVRSMTDADAVRELARVNGDLARLGNLLKLWLDNDARTAKFGSDTILALLARIEQTQDSMRGLIQSVARPRISA